MQIKNNGKYRLKVVAVLTCCFFVLIQQTACKNVSDDIASSTNTQNSTSYIKGESPEKFKILTSFYPMYIAALNITDNAANIELKNLANPQTGCLHDYQLRPTDMAAIEKSDVFVANGAGMESFLDQALKQKPDLNLIEATDGLTLLESSLDGHNHEAKEETEESEDFAQNHDDHDHNPHAWLDLDLYIGEIRNISKELSIYNPENAAIYKENTDLYIGKINDLKQLMKTELAQVKDNDVVILHEAFAYLVEAVNMHVSGALEVETDSGMSAKQIREIISTVNESNAKILLAEKQYSGNIGSMLTRETGLKSYTLDSLVTGELEKDAYIKGMTSNIMILKEASKHE